MRRAAAWLVGVGAWLASATLAAAPAAPVDRALVRFVTRETGGIDAPRFVYERELAFQARLEALAEDRAAGEEGPYRPRHVRAALERHIAETVLSALGVTPPPKPREIAERVDLARIALAERVGGLGALGDAARAEGLAENEVFRLLRRQALASLYLDRMVAPLLEPSDAELRSVHRTQRTPFSGRPFDEVQAVLGRWYVGTRLEAALGSFYDGLRTRLRMTVLR